jgi:hypothetical protein
MAKGGGNNGGRGERGPGRTSGRGPNYRRPGGGGGGTGGNTGGTKHKSSSTARGPVAGIVFAVSAFALVFVGSPVAYLVWAYLR